MRFLSQIYWIAAALIVVMFPIWFRRYRLRRLIKFAEEEIKSGDREEWLEHITLRSYMRLGIRLIGGIGSLALSIYLLIKAKELSFTDWSIGNVSIVSMMALGLILLSWSLLGFWYDRQMIKSFQGNEEVYENDR